MYDIELVKPQASRDPGKLLWPQLLTADEQRALEMRENTPDMNETHNTRVAKEVYSEYEGGMSTEGYVPLKDDGTPLDSSGPTFGTGDDIGGWNRNTFREMGIDEDPEVVMILTPGIGLKGAAAKVWVDSAKPKLTKGQAEWLDKKVSTWHLGKLIKAYENAPENKAGIKFKDLPPAAQTVLYSVFHQYGVNMPERTPNFWKHVTSQDWNAAYRELMDFRDKTPTRRKKEASYLKENLLKGIQ